MTAPRLVTHVSDDEFAVWQREQQARILIARGAANTPPPKTAADVLVASLRKWNPDAVVGTFNPDRWRSDCPACGAARSLRISAHQDGSVAAWCLGPARCKQTQIVEALKEHLGRHDCDEARFWRECALDGLELLHKVQTLADELLGEIVHSEMTREAA